MQSVIVVSCGTPSPPLVQNVEVKDPAPEPQCSYYEQFVIDGNRFRLGKQGCHVVDVC